MSTRRSACCAVCHATRVQGTRWFQLVENRWTDRLRILRFQEEFANQADVHSVCGASHLREMVVHWMTTGRLDHPFARLPLAPKSIFRRRATLPTVAKPAPLLDRSKFVGEIAVHRESLTRILRQNPMALSGLLEAVVSAAESEEGLPSPTIPGHHDLKGEQPILF